MKKLLLATGILALSAIAFGSTTTTANGYAEDSVLVKAEVVGPLTLTKQQDLDFGVLFPGDTKASDSAKEGKIEIKGTPNANVKVEMSATANTFTSQDLTGVQMTLTNTADKISTMPATIDLKSGTGAFATNVFSLGDTGVLNFNVGGKVTADGNQKPGKYEATLYVRAKYNN